MPKYYLFIILVFTLSGCTTIRIINPDSPSDLEKLPGGKKKVTITTTTQQNIPAIKLQANPDSATWYNPSLRQVQIVSTPEIQKVTRDQRQHSGAIGLVLGSICGVIVGGTIGETLSDPDQDSFIDSGAAVGGLIGFFVGAIAGANIAGKALGNKTIYQFQKTTTESLHDTSKSMNKTHPTMVNQNSDSGFKQ